MKFLNVIRSSIFQILSFIFVMVFLLGVLNIHFSDKNNYCEMTYMFEYPQFVRISTVPENIPHPQYGLYAYSEGRFTERARKMWFDGIPVLFLPGHSGSHQQARSLASVALRKTLSKGYDYHFDFFTVSFNEELSAFNGGVLLTQMKFAATCLETILNLYKDNKYTKSVPTSVILIGHSMGGIIAKRLMAQPNTTSTTNIAITLAAPLESPVVNVDINMNNFYLQMDLEWSRLDPEVRKKKLLLSFGNGPRDILMPSGLTYSNESYINALTTAIPGVWVSSDHVSIVWCKQLVMAVTKYLFDIIDPRTEQVSQNKELWMTKAREYFQANRSMFLSPDINRANITMLADAFWYEDNRRIYQISRPEIDKTTYLMIRLVNFPQNRFVAVETVNVDDRDWIFVCSAKFTYNTHRYCKHATSLSELSRWTGAAPEFGKRKLATVHLHSLMKQNPDWTHVIVKVSPTRKPITLNVDINDHASRQIVVDGPLEYSFGKMVILAETERNSVYYELILRDFNALHQAYLLYVEPTASCKALQYHASAEVHIPWAKNYEYYHYFTHLKRSPMKLRLFRSNPNVTHGSDTAEHVTVTLLLDPQCTYTVSISISWYHRLAQVVRNYSSVLIPYMAAILLLAFRSNLRNFEKRGKFASIHTALMSEEVKPYYVLVYGRLGTAVFMSLPPLMYVFENPSWKNMEMQYFTRSLLVLPAYMTALGLLNILAATVLVSLVFASQIVHKFLYRIIWRGGSILAERFLMQLQMVPIVVSVVMLLLAPVSCGAVALVAGAAYYAFLLSKMYEEYLEDYFYKLMAKVASKICRIFFSRSRNRAGHESETSLVPTETPVDESASKKLEPIEDKSDVEDKEAEIENKDEKTEDIHNDVIEDNDKCDNVKENEQKNIDDNDDVMTMLNYHTMMFLMWLLVTLVNMPALVTWARNFKYDMTLWRDMSYNSGMGLTGCTLTYWQMKAPRRNLKYHEHVSALLFIMAIMILVYGPFSLSIVNYGVTYMFIIVAMHQICDQETVDAINSGGRSIFLSHDKREKMNDVSSNQSNSDEEKDNVSSDQSNSDEKKKNVSSDQSNSDEKKKNVSSDQSNSDEIKNNVSSEQSNPDEKSKGSEQSSKSNSNEDCVCNQNRIYRIFKNLREKLNIMEE